MIYGLFFVLGFVYGWIIKRGGQVWRIKNVEVVNWPFHSAFGIAFVVSAVWAMGELRWGELALVFLSAFPGIVWGAQQPSKSIVDRLEIIKRELKKIESDGFFRLRIGVR